MSARPASGVLTISIDWSADAAGPDLVAQRALAQLGDNLAALFDALELPATLAVADPTAISSAQGFSASPVGHEIAILGDASWMGRDVPPSRFARELARRIEGGRRAGHSVSTLVVKSPALDHAGLAARHGITAVRHMRTDKSTAGRGLRSRALQFGLWSFPVTITLPGGSRLWPGGGGGRSARAAIDQSIAQGGLVQLVIEASRMAAKSASYRVLQCVLQHVKHRRDQGLLEVLTIGAMAARLSTQRQGQPSRSILQSAA
jgi:hypothetical protein